MIANTQIASFSNSLHLLFYTPSASAYFTNWQISPFEARENLNVSMTENYTTSDQMWFHQDFLGNEWEYTENTGAKVMDLETEIWRIIQNGDKTSLGKRRFVQPTYEGNDKKMKQVQNHYYFFSFYSIYKRKSSKKNTRTTLSISVIMQNGDKTSLGKRRFVQPRYEKND